MNSATPSALDLPVKTDVWSSFSEFETKRQTRLLNKFSPLLKPALRPDEMLLFGSPARRRSISLERFLRGLLFSNRHRLCVVIFSTQRLFVLPTGSDFLPRNAISVVELGDVNSMHLSGIVSKKLIVTYRSGRAEVFTMDFEDIAAQLPDVFGDSFSSLPRSDRGERFVLCPKCYAAIPAGEYRCGGCGAEFKTHAELRRRALLVPGGAYFYIGETFYGVLASLGESVILFYMFIVLLDMFANGGDRKSITALIGGAMLLSIEKWMAMRHANAAIDNYIGVADAIG
jgi:hypothetical protein